MKNEFPKDFLWGAAISAYQTEGDNSNSDWWEWEKDHGRESSGKACRHYELYQKDWDLAAQLHLNAIRLSVEWSRIEPKENNFDTQAINHYVEVVRALKERGIEPMVTLHHFTNPQWFARSGGWYNSKSAFYFSRYTEKIVSFLSPYVRYWVTFNEPLVYIYYGYLKGIWPPQEKSIPKGWRAQGNFINAHAGAYKTIKKIYREQGLASPLVSLAKHLRGFQVLGNNPYHKVIAKIKDYFFNINFLQTLIAFKTIDFIGVNYYAFEFLPTSGMNLPTNSMGWPIYPEGLFLILLRLKRYNLPIMILENGICTDDDRQRWNFIDEHISSIKQAILRGVKVCGYFYWSLIDNFEWDKGFGPRFGLIEVDYATYERRIRQSAYQYSREICKNRQI